MNYALLIFLFVAHFFADFTHASTPWMLNAKRLGTPLFPIFCHALSHAVAMFLIMLVFSTPHALWLALLQLITHFMIDVWKGRMNWLFPELQSPANKAHWYIFGFDQLLHQVTIVLMVYISTK